ncbi:MAG: response regulator [Rhodocyclales bacterium]|nr:response regulator [Rhodocyclales bacterium]
MTSDTAAMKRLLLLDDDRLVLATLGEGLRQAGYYVDTASSVEEAEDILAGGSIDLAIFDVRMPGQSGVDLAWRLHEADSEVPFIFLTAYSDDELVEQASEAGAMGYVVKPADPDRLVPAIEAAFARSEDARKLRETSRQLQTALDADRDVSLAIGIIMERRRLGRQEAFELLRGQARTERRKLIDLARDIVLASEKLNLISAPAPAAEPRPRRQENRDSRRERH